MQAGIVQFKFHETGTVVEVTTEQASELQRTGQGVVLSGAQAVSPRQAMAEAASHVRVYATIPQEVMELVSLRIRDDKVQHMDSSITTADVVASLLRDYGKGKVSIKSGILKSL